MLFRTANGTVTARESLDISIKEMGLDMSGYILPNAPPLMSLGRRCLRDGFSFVWIANQRPYFVRPDGKIVRLDVIGGHPLPHPWQP